MTYPTKFSRETSAASMDSNLDHIDNDVVIINDRHIAMCRSGQHHHAGLSHDNNCCDIARQDGYMNQTVLPRPSYYFLRILGAWQPKNCHPIFHVYSVISFGILILSMLSILGLECVHRQGFLTPGGQQWKLGSILNSVFTLLNLTCPFIFIKYYFRHGSYDQLLVSVFQSSFEHRGRVRFLSRVYSCISLILWLLGVAFFYAHWLPFFSQIWHYVLYAVVLFYSTGWWATWLSIYGFVCHVHSIQGQIFIEHMQSCFQMSNRTRNEERKRVGLLLGAYNDFSRWIERTQSEFGKIVSFAITYHVVDIIVFTVAYLDKDFGSSDVYPFYQYIGGVGFDLTSIAIKLYPAAIVSMAIHRITQRSGSECYVHYTNVEMPEERFQLYQHLNIREQDIGLRILGVKISVRIAVGIFVTIVTALGTFLRFVIVNLTSKHSIF
eukprot:gene11031-12195_t